MERYAIGLWERKSTFLLSHFEWYNESISLVSKMVYPTDWNLLLSVSEEGIGEKWYISYYPHIMVRNTFVSSWKAYLAKHIGELNYI